MGLEIQRIHARPNDCMLYRNDDANLSKCRICGTPRYKRIRTKENTGGKRSKGPPSKMLWYLPIVPRLRRLFANAKDARLLRWHAEERKMDGKIRHVADSPQWRNIDRIFEEFGTEREMLGWGLVRTESIHLETRAVDTVLGLFSFVFTIFNRGYA